MIGDSRVASKTLALAGDVDSAPTALALERLRIIPYDLLITDLKMPVDGLTVIREAGVWRISLPYITGSTEASDQAVNRRLAISEALRVGGARGQSARRGMRLQPARSRRRDKIERFSRTPYPLQ